MNSKPNKVTPISFEEMQGILARASVIAQKENELQFLNNEKRQFWQTLMKKYKLEPDVDYQLDSQNNLLIWKEGKKSGNGRTP